MLLPTFWGMPFYDLLQQRAHPVVASLNSHKVLLYALVSTVVVSATITNALRSHSNFYSVAIYLSKSNRSVLVRRMFNCNSFCALTSCPDPCKFRPSYCITLWATRATDILRCPSSSGGGGRSYSVTSRLSAQLSFV